MLSSWPHPAPSATIPASVTWPQPLRSMFCSSLHPAPNATTPASVNWPQPPRLMPSSLPHPAPNATTPASVTLSQPSRIMPCSWPHPAPNATTPASVTLSQPPRSMFCSLPHPAPNATTPTSVTWRQPVRWMLRSLWQLFTKSTMHWSVMLWHLFRPRCTMSLVSSSKISQPRTGEESASISTCDARIPLFDSHISDDRLWPQFLIALDLKHRRTVNQLGLNLWLETATSKVVRLRTSSQRDMIIIWISSLSKGRNDGTMP